jgi:hypothetical protein
MWIVAVALPRPYTFLMLAALIVLLGVFAILTTPTDIFPAIRIPIVAVIWRYTGLLPDEMADRIVLFSERTAQTVVNDVEHTESQSVNGTAVVKYFFQPNVKQELAFAQITALSQSQLKARPRVRPHPSSSPTMPRRYRFCRWRCPAKPFPNSRSSIWEATSSAHSSPRLQAPPFPIHWVANSVRFRLIWIRRSCGRTDSPGQMSCRPLRRRT